MKDALTPIFKEHKLTRRDQKLARHLMSIMVREKVLFGPTQYTPLLKAIKEHDPIGVTASIGNIMGKDHPFTLAVLDILENL